MSTHEESRSSRTDLGPLDGPKTGAPVLNPVACEAARTSAKTNIADRLRAQADAQPYARAVMCPVGRDHAGRRAYAQSTFLELDRLCDRYARGFEEIGIRRGTRCLVFVTPSIEYFALAFALYRVGAITVMIDPAMGKKNVLLAISEVEPEAIVAVPKAHLLRTLYPRAFRSVRVAVTVGRRYAWGGRTLREVERLGEGQGRARQVASDTASEETAAILFTSGSTGAPKGVVYSHGILDTQVEVFRRELGIGPGEVDLSAFPPFSLFSLALGASVVVPDMDVTRPARVDPERILEAVRDHGVTYVFGSPAFWHRVAGYALDRGVVLESLRRVLMAGAPAPVALLERLTRIIPEEADIHTPYGATESLPITMPSAKALLAGPARRSAQGAGTWVGRPVDGAEVRVIRIVESALPSIADAEILRPGEIGEIIVKSPVTTRAYFRRDADNARSKIRDGDSIWHRMGDVGHLDDDGCLWFAGRQSHRVETTEGVMFSVPCEVIFDRHAAVFRSALVGVGPAGAKRPVICIECHPHARPRTRRAKTALAKAILDLGRTNALTARVETVLFVEAFPVDARHNAKIRREELAVLAERKLGSRFERTKGAPKRRPGHQKEMAL